MTRRTSTTLAELIAIANIVLPKPGAAPAHAAVIAGLKDDIAGAIKRGEAGTGSAILAFALMHLATERMVLVELHHLVEIAAHAREMVRDNELHAAIVREGVAA